MIRRLLWFAALSAIAIVTTVLQFDRQADVSPALAATVPEAARAYAQMHVAFAATRGENPAAALAAAKALLRRRPMPAEHLTLLASAQAKAGQGEAAAFTIQIAGQRGWREPVAQEAVLRLALAAGDKAEAARRFAALLRREATPDALLTELGPAVFGDSAGPSRETLATIIANAARWHEQFLRRGPQVLPADAFGAITTLAIERGARFKCEAIAPAIESLRQRDAPAAGALSRAAQGRCV